MFWRKTVTTTNVYTEVELQEVAARLGFSPRIVSVTEKGDKSVIKMERVNGTPLSDLYGDDCKNIPENIWNKIRFIISELYGEGIEYVDITPYNFIQCGDDIKIIDFGDAKYSDSEINWFLNDFLDGLNEWNPDFK
jgi:tRNA A-37 threonylcarbamoyl transferase component Bud32